MTIIDEKYDEIILMLVWCMRNKPSPFMDNMMDFYLDRGYLTEKQAESIKKTYSAYHKK